MNDSEMQANVNMGDILNDIAQEIAEMLGRLPDNAFLYAEVDDEGREASVFTENDDGIFCHRPSNEMFELVGNFGKRQTTTKNGLRWNMTLLTENSKQISFFQNRLIPKKSPMTAASVHCESAMATGQSVTRR